MFRFITQRILVSLPVLAVITMIIFAMLQFTPGDPLDAYIPPDQQVSQAQRTQLRHELGLDQAAPIRYLYWLREAARGNLGYRIKDYQPVGKSIALRIGPTFLLMISGMGLGVVLGILFGVIAAVRKYTVLDSFLTVVAFLGISTPAFLAGLIALYIFSLRLHVFPSGGLESPGLPFSMLDRLRHLILPASVLSMFYVAVVMRYTRTAMLDAVGQDYVRTARSKGLPELSVIGKHALRNALLPVVTVVGANLANLLGGAVFLESIFSWPGMGLLYVDGVESRDYPLIMGLTLVLAAAVLIANILTDLAYALIDPRIRYG